MKTTTIATLTVLSLAFPSFAADHSAMGHQPKAEAADARSAAKGREIRSANVQGYDFTYRLIDMKDEMKAMPMPGKDMEGGKMKSHHLMVYLKGPDGKPATQGKVGYRVAGPDKSEQKTMAMGMDGGFGADVDLKAKGAYKITTKAVLGEKTLVDEFTYTVK